MLRFNEEMEKRLKFSFYILQGSSWSKQADIEFREKKTQHEGISKHEA